MPVALIIDCQSSLGTNGIRLQHLFRNLSDADGAFQQIRDAAVAYGNRANDREKIISFSTLTGNAAVDVSQIVSVQVDDPLGHARVEVEAWNNGIAEIGATSKLAASAISGSVEDESAAPKGDAQ